MKRITAIGLTILLIVVLTVQVLAQADTCPALVQAALAAAANACANLGRNEACYGNIHLTVEAQPGLSGLKLDAPGDRVEVASIHTLHLSSMNAALKEWGVALLKLQANLPQTLPGQNVTVVLFGDVQIENTVPSNVADSTPEPTGVTQSPMQAFTFRSGVKDAPCTQAPDSGLLIQTPKGAGVIQLTVNGVEIALGSTAYLQAQPGGVMKISVIEGQARVTAFGVERVVPAGGQVQVPLNTTGQASGAPEVVKAYVRSDVRALPIVLLERSITIAPPLAESSACTVSAGKAVNLRSGPGTTYGIQGGLSVGKSQTPQGQTQGTDGKTWWKLANGGWVRSDLVSKTGNCVGLPRIVDIPPTPVPSQVTSTNDTGTGNYGSMVLIGAGAHGCVTTPVVRAGQVTLNLGLSRSYWASCEAAKADVAGRGLATFSGTGPTPTNYRLSGCHNNPDNGEQGITTEADVTLSPGVYTYNSVWLDGQTDSCTFTVK